MRPSHSRDPNLKIGLQCDMASSEKFQVSRAARNFRAKRERLRIPSAAEGGLTMESAKLQAAKRP